MKRKSKPAPPPAPVVEPVVLSKPARPRRARQLDVGRVVDVLVPRVGDQLDERAHVDDVTRPRLGEG